MNAAGGLLGRKLEYLSEDDQTNAEAGVRGARKLIDVDKVQAIMSVWASAVGSAVLPLCWENKVMMLAISAADSIAALPHQGYFVRTQPHTELQGKEFGRFILGQGAKSVYLIMPQTPFTETVFKAIRETVEPKGVKVASAIIDNKKTSFRSEIDEMTRANPDIFMMGGYLAENIVMAKDLFRANFKGKVMGFAYGITPAFVDGAGKEAAEGIFSIADPSPAFDSSAYAKLKALVKRDELDTFSCQAYDHANLAILSMAKGKDASGTAIRDNIRKISNNDARPGGRQRARRPEGDRRGQGDQVFRRLRTLQVRRQRQHHRGAVPHRAGEGRQDRAVKCDVIALRSPRAPYLPLKGGGRRTQCVGWGSLCSLTTAARI